MVNTQSLFAMEIENGLKLPVNTDTDILMDDLNYLQPSSWTDSNKFQDGWNIL